MTAIESVIEQLKEQQRAAVDGDAMAQLRLARLVMGAWPTILHALEELDRRRIA